MTFTNPNHTQPKSISFKENVSNINLIVQGQGVFIFKIDKNNCIFYIQDNNETNSLKIEFNKYAVNVTRLPRNEPLVDENNKQGLINKSGAYYWVSLDYQNQRIYAGIGEPRRETHIYSYQFYKKDKTIWELNKTFLRSLTKINIENNSIKPLQMLRDPITFNVPLLVKDTDDLSMYDVARGEFLPSSNLELTARKLYDCIAGKNFILDDNNFPDFSKAIEYSIATPGCWCNTTLINKSKEFSKDPNIKETYLRITLGRNNGESPGIPYVMEIWPIGHYSPIHNHGGSHAIIRVLHGSINVNLYPFLCPDKNEILPFASKEFFKNDITWISPNLNQVHQLKNHENNKNTCITIQCYMYDENNTRHYDYFDYLDGDDKKLQYEPDSDMDFIKFRHKMKQEWENRSWMDTLSCMTKF